MEPFVARHPLFFGAALFVISGVGPLVVAGPLVASLVAALEGAVLVGAIGALGAGLVRIGVPQDSIVQYKTAVKAGNFLVVAHGFASQGRPGHGYCHAR